MEELEWIKNERQFCVCISRHVHWKTSYNRNRSNLRLIFYTSFIFSGDKCRIESDCAIKNVVFSLQMLILTCPSAAVCDDIADLINGYCKLETGTERDIWTKEKRESRRQSIILSPNLRSQSGGSGSDRKSGSVLDSSRSDYAEVVDDIEADYSAPLGW